MLELIEVDAKDARRSGAAAIPDPVSMGQAQRPRILVSDDQHDILTALELLLKMNGYRTRRADSPSQLLAEARESPFDLVLMDLNYTRDTTSGQEGLELLAELRQLHAAPPIVVMTAWGNVELAVEAMRLGASDFVQKPWDNGRLLQTVSKVLVHSAKVRQAEAKTQSELEIARNVHQKLFPQHLKAMKQLQYAGDCVSARVVGGDYYDFFDTGEDQLGFILADVSGKGVAAAMLMANLQACLRTQIEAGVKRPEELLGTANRLFYESTPDAQYVTLFYGTYDDLSGRLEYVNCGHPAPILLRANGQVERLEATCTVLGLFPEWKSACAATVLLNPGDLLVAFTDGVTDAVLADGSELGEERLIAILEGERPVAPASCIRRLMASTEPTNTLEGAFDDRTVVALRRL